MTWFLKPGGYLNQIEDKHYENDVLEEGYPSVLKYGICFYKKECMVMTN